ncbi:MAG: hypothetical protein QJR10_04620 [Bacillota bacterium]|nr:hypothetical protein [Bacillota bacterium]
MTQEEIRATYTELADIVRAAGLAWILSQVEQTVHAGRAVEKPTRVFKEEDRDDGTLLFSDEQYGSRRGGKRIAMMALEPWPDRDQVLFLIDGLRHAIVHAAEIENDQIRLLRSFGDVEQVSFESETNLPNRSRCVCVGFTMSGSSV